MAITVVEGKLFNGVEVANAEDAKGGYFVGFSATVNFLCVDETHPASLVGVKYSTHEVNDTAGPRPPDGHVRVTMLVSGGPWRQRMWSEDTLASVELLLNSPGDFIAWTPGLLHQWWAQGPATMVTVTLDQSASMSCNEPTAAAAVDETEEIGPSENALLTTYEQNWAHVRHLEAQRTLSMNIFVAVLVAVIYALSRAESAFFAPYALCVLAFFAGVNLLVSVKTEGIINAYVGRSVEITKVLQTSQLAGARVREGVWSKIRLGWIYPVFYGTVLFGSLVIFVLWCLLKLVCSRG